jgi:hypothetical protein
MGEVSRLASQDMELQSPEEACGEEMHNLSWIILF